MPNRDNLSNLQMVHLGALTLSGTTPSASAWVDCREFDSATLVLTTGAVTDAGTVDGFTAQLQEGADTTAAGAVDISGATIAVTSDTDDNKVIGAVRYSGIERYARLNITGTTGTNAVVSVYAILGNPGVAPTTFVGTSVAAT